MGSHFKAECASTARLLHMQLQLALNARIFLDSAFLTDLRELFDKGLFQSDVLVVLLTKSYLSRPWCLLEIWEASRANIPLLPVVITPVHGELGFNLDSAY